MSTPNYATLRSAYPADTVPPKRLRKGESGCEDWKVAIYHELMSGDSGQKRVMSVIMSISSLVSIANIKERRWRRYHVWETAQTYGVGRELANRHCPINCHRWSQNRIATEDTEATETKKE
jgi:hypothetical protein